MKEVGIEEKPMELLDQYLESRGKILEYFGYVEEWRKLPIDDEREYYSIGIEDKMPSYWASSKQVEKLGQWAGFWLILGQ
jgi:hypothetical protein